MKHYLIPILLITLAFSAYCQSVQIITSPWPPYADKALTDWGFTTEIIRYAFARSGYHAEIDIIEWPAAMEMGREGKCDGLYNVYPTEERENLFHFSDPYFASKSYLVCLRCKEFDFSSIESLRGRKIGVLKEYAQAEPFYQLKNITEYILDWQALHGLLEGEVEAVPMDIQVAAYLMKTHPRLLGTVDDLAFIGAPIVDGPMHIMFPKNRKGIENVITAFNDGLKAIREDGTYDKILLKHSQETYDPNGR